MTRPRKKSRRKRDSNPGSSALEVGALTTWPTRRSEHTEESHVEKAVVVVVVVLLLAVVVVVVVAATAVAVVEGGGAGG